VVVVGSVVGAAVVAEVTVVEVVEGAAAVVAALVVGGESSLPHEARPVRPRIVRQTRSARRTVG
jgi:hypothetical protein